MSNDLEKDATEAIADFIIIPLLFLLGLFVIASLVEIALNANIVQFKLLFIAIAGAPLYILYFREKLTEKSVKESSNLDSI